MIQQNTVLMLIPSLIKKQKAIAWFLFLLFYADFALGSFVARKRQPLFYSAISGNNKPVKPIPVAEKTLLQPVRNKKNATISSLPKAGNEKLGRLQVLQSPFKINIGGPGQPEMATFKSIGADNMVSPFTGDFSYNIPLVDVGGYPINIFYNGGVSMEQEASWVGLGWNLNPGSVSRNMRGLPDDFNGEDRVIKEMSTANDMTVGVTAATSAEIIGEPKTGNGPSLSASINAGISWNSKRGLGLAIGGDGQFSMHKMITKTTKDEKTSKIDTIANATGSLNASLNLSSMDGLTTSFGMGVQIADKDKTVRYGLSTDISYNSMQGLGNLRMSGEAKNYVDKYKDWYGFTPSGSMSFARSSFMPSMRMTTTSFNALLGIKLGKENKVFFKNGDLQASISDQYIEDKILNKPAVGFMYYEKAMGNKDAMMDFNRLNDGAYTIKTPVISIPVYTYDIFTISGEGTGGSFRGYRGGTGYVKDYRTVSKTGKGSLNFDLGGGNKAKLGLTVGGAYSQTSVDEWSANNPLKEKMQFNASNGASEGFYFKNPGEKAIIDETYYNAVGKDKLVRPALLPDGPGVTTIYTPTPGLEAKYEVFDEALKKESDLPITGKLERTKRDKRSQVISYLTASEASLAGLDKQIWAWKENTFLPGSCRDKNYVAAFSRWDDKNNGTNPRKSHHLSEITVLEGDARRYVYGLPVYTKDQKEVTFSITNEPVSKNEVGYNGGIDNSILNSQGDEKFFQSQKIQNFAHNFLLTAILSPDYMDVTGDGITDDDLGTAVKFNYSCANLNYTGNTAVYAEDYKWRVPVSPDANQPKANFNRGLKTDKTDNKANYVFGSKELWYLHSLESKNMVATFTVSKRADGLQSTGENGGVNNVVCQRRLDRIDLYTKADYAKKGANATPVKSVHFEYSYELCKKYNLNSNANEGKLTLKKIWFTYNGSNKKSGLYVFGYSSLKNGINTNPDYDALENDRWGNYKPAAVNPGGMANEDYPYAVQNKQQADAYAAAWGLEKILLPGGSVINVEYEADDYAYVQDRRAAVATTIAGFGRLSNSTPTSQIYTVPSPLTALTLNNTNCALWDNRFVFFDVPQSITGGKAEIMNKYLQGINQLLLKLWVEVPGDEYGSGYEPMMVYAGIKDYNVVAGNANRFYVELTPAGTGGSPIVETVVDFMRRQLTSKVYPGYKNKEGNDIKKVAKAVWGMIDQVRKAVKGFEVNFKISRYCMNVNLQRSMARLNAPGFSKTGGGHRVKKILITDNWDELSKYGGNKVEKASYYGQEYDYTTTEKVGSQEMIISSGVASYEPGAGAEENPFREAYRYFESQPLGPTRPEVIEMPLAETFYPSSMVGYSKVTVRSIHNRSNKNIKSGVGKQVSEFYTTKDFPVITDFTPFDNQSLRSYKPNPVEELFKFANKDLLTLTQGVRVVLNDMNGKPKASYSYPEGEDKAAINSTQYYYRTTKVGENKYKLNNVLPVIENATGVVTDKIVGRDVEVMNDSREHYSYTYAGQLPINSEFFTAGNIPFLIPTVFRMLFRDESLYRSFTTMKVVNEFGILEKVVNNDKGSIVSTENMVYDAETGGVLVTKTNNEFKDPVYNVNYPAHWAEVGMEPAYKNIDVTYNHVVFRNGRLETAGVDMNLFESGDELLVIDNSKKGSVWARGCDNPGADPCEKLPKSAENRIWALDFRKDPANTVRDFIFLDRYGNPYNGGDVYMRIIRSGRRNMAGMALGGVTTQNNPVVNVNGVNKLVIEDSRNILGASAALYKERWKTQDMFYTKDSMMSATLLAPVRKLTLFPVDDHVTIKSPSVSDPGGFAFSNQQHRMYFVTSHFDNKEVKSWMKFNMTAIPQGSQFVAANLYLDAHHSIADGSGHTEGIQHNGLNPHRRNGWENSMTMNLHIGRLMAAWDAPEATWNGTVFNQVSPASSTASATLASWLPEANDFVSASPYNINVKPMMNDMLADYYTKGYATAFSIWHSNRTSGQTDNSRFCFATESNMPIPPPPLPGEPELGLTRTHLKVKYINCAEAYGLPGNPASPPAGQEVAECTGSMAGNKVCLSVFTKQFINPYVQGILGNWRPWRSYVYYGERREGDPLSATDIRKNGVIKDFAPYWILPASATAKMQPGSSSKWVWNSEVMQYNRKGAQLEDHDPLNRYNAAIYGYQETLPVATVSNSPVRLSAYDGFEDYGYQDDPCEPYCKPASRHFTTGITLPALDSIESHTGRYSLAVAAGTTKSFTMPVAAAGTVQDPAIRIDVLQNAFNDTLLVPAGKGLTARYYEGACWEGAAYTTSVSPQLNHWFNSADTYGNEPFQFSHYEYPRQKASARYTGKLQVDKSGWYRFILGAYRDFASLAINGQVILRDGSKAARNTGCTGLTASNKILFYDKLLVKGTIYNVEAKYSNIKSSQGAFSISWLRPCEDATELLPTVYLYPENITPPAPAYGTVPCYKPQEVKVSNALTDVFALVPGERMVSGIWVKKDGPACNCSSYTGITIVIKNNSTVIGALQPAGKIIEGWQLFEGEFTVPPNTSLLSLETIVAAASPQFYLDDLRIHPFNANMKSFVFDPQTLWLTSELDENNYASFYEYDDEGTLVRVKKETKGGIKTIKETRSAIQSKITGL
jgi:hypothetical protein